MKMMCDTNVILDVLLEREPFVEDSCKFLKLCEEHKIDGFVLFLCLPRLKFFSKSYNFY